MPSMIIGGVAASILGRPRLTQDVDALAILPEADWADAVSTAVRHGILPRIENPLDFARRSRVLLMRHTESGIDIDVTFGGLSFELTAIDNSQIHDIGGLRGTKQIGALISAASLSPQRRRLCSLANGISSRHKVASSQVPVASQRTLAG